MVVFLFFTAFLSWLCALERLTACLFLIFFYLALRVRTVCFAIPSVLFELYLHNLNASFLATVKRDSVLLKCFGALCHLACHIAQTGSVRTTITVTVAFCVVCAGCQKCKMWHNVKELVSLFDLNSPQMKFKSAHSVGWNGKTVWENCSVLVSLFSLTWFIFIIIF